MAIVTMKQLLESGVHSGIRSLEPKMKSYIFTERNGIYIIDLQQTVKLMDVACLVRDIAARGGNIIFVGTKKQAQSRSGWRRSGVACIMLTSVGWAACSPIFHHQQADHGLP